MIAQFISNLPAIIVRLITLCFFSIGFIQYYQRVWSDVFEPTDINHPASTGRRVYLNLLSLVLGLGVNILALGWFTGESLLTYNNLALYALTLALMYGGFNTAEVALQFAAVLTMWITVHWANLTALPTLISFVLFIITVVFMHQFRDFFMSRWQWYVSGAIVVSGLFWLAAPSVLHGQPMTGAVRFQGMLLYTLMGAFVIGYWLRQYNEDKRRRELERLADYERGTQNDTYADTQHELAELIKSALITKQPLTFVEIDLDNFRQINDRFGHLAGNAVLIGVTDTVRTLLDRKQVDYRMAMTTGEEFTLVFPNKSAEDILPEIKGVWQAIRKSEYKFEARSLAVTASIGMTDLLPEDNDLNELYKRADSSLSRSKRNGRDMITLNGKTIVGTDHSQKRLGDYAYFVQGIYEMRDGKPVIKSHELLLRTYDKMQDRWILPDSFELPAWMQIALLKSVMDRTGIRTFNINLTAAQFEDVELAEALSQFVESADGPDQLNVEITDLTDSQTTRRICAVYRDSGIKIMIDDVGSDNSFEVVRDALPYVNNVKFAMQNLRKQTTAAELKERAQFWYQTAVENHLTFVLEGVENDSDIQMAKELGIKQFQGYHFDKPHLPEAMEA
ncbi:GGDEF domain-containing protein [Lacticaseibacillus sharpeae]|uniref:GGDEF domain-containing protein n=1 Tax=Lacticaseibacillus sharpeae TaxID=1626 RepID=UPI0006CFCB8F|nr:diguanylate cyclase [Lacticaseibacillus sharpeae]